MLRAPLKPAAAALAAALVCQGCEIGTACPAIAIASLNVTVVDASTGQQLCGATVTATEEAFSERLRQFGTNPPACGHAGAYERPGNYSIRAEREGYLPARVDNVMVRLGPGPCVHVGTAFVTLALERR